MSPASTPAMTGDGAAVEYRGKVRPRDRETSWEAAGEQTNTKSAILQKQLYALLLIQPRTHDELHAELCREGVACSPSGVRTRMHELEIAGWVSATTDRRPSDLGGPSTVWRAVLDEEPEAAVPEPPKPTGRAYRRSEQVGAFEATVWVFTVADYEVLVDHLGHTDPAEWGHFEVFIDGDVAGRFTAAITSLGEVEPLALAILDGWTLPEPPIGEEYEHTDEAAERMGELL